MSATFFYLPECKTDSVCGGIGWGHCKTLDKRKPAEYFTF